MKIVDNRGSKPVEVPVPGDFVRGDVSGAWYLVTARQDKPYLRLTDFTNWSGLNYDAHVKKSNIEITLKGDN